MASEDADVVGGNVVDDGVNTGTASAGTPAAAATDGGNGPADAGRSPDSAPLDPQVAAAVAAAEAAGPGAGESVRIDSWIWAVRLIKTRSLGATACRGGHVHVNGDRVKPAYSVRVGDEVRLRHEGRERVVIVKRLIRKRVGAPVAVHCYVDNSPPPPPRDTSAPAGVRDRGTGRPTKRDRREMERLRGVGGTPGFAVHSPPPPGFANPGTASQQEPEEAKGEQGEHNADAKGGRGDRDNRGRDHRDRRGHTDHRDRGRAPGGRRRER
ncbi:RNA-binding S4 domain-containing protein [Streptomyces sp. J2-1]|uniref:RNA-binding S4 domain-containing protein n=1 Tax=Streptomyces corallincola TaxID=2851888 RepID=UPI001C3915CA|nr:RNA-binding S4 domain-containing protein [Streptomyces corallincola]MBV2357623.1 RNA-binding S4 domain-containing protein [Streptomyces corallincola]